MINSVNQSRSKYLKKNFGSLLNEIQRLIYRHEYIALENQAMHDMVVKLRRGMQLYGVTDFDSLDGETIKLLIKYGQGKYYSAKSMYETINDIETFRELMPLVDNVNEYPESRKELKELIKSITNALAKFHQMQQRKN